MKRQQLIREIDLIPEDRLEEVYDLVHSFRRSLKNHKAQKEHILRFAGSWQDMTDEDFADFLEEIHSRRESAFGNRARNR